MKPLNSKAIKVFNKQLWEQYGCYFPLDGFFFENRGKIYFINRALDYLDWKRLKFHSLGLYLGEFKGGLIRLSPEASRIIPAKKNVIELNEAQARMYISGADFSFDVPDGPFVIVHYKEDVLGSAKPKGGMLLNYLPKEYRKKEVLL